MTTLNVCGALAFVGLAVAPPASAQQPELLQKLTAADSLARMGRTDDADQLFRQVLSSATDAGTMARAQFGRTYVAQIKVAGRKYVFSEHAVQSVVSGYQAAWRLDSARYFASAQNNIGILALNGAEPRQALLYFYSAAATARDSVARGRYYLNAGRAFEELSLADSAAIAYAWATHADPNNSTARQRRLALSEGRQPDDSILAIVDASLGAGRDLDRSVETLFRMLTRSTTTLSPDRAERALVSMVRGFALLRLSPPIYEKGYQYRMPLIVRLHPELQQPMASLALVFGRETRTGVNPADDRWWHETTARRLPWSMLLRNIGDHYRWQRDNRAAVAFYEAAIGWHGRQSQRLVLDGVDRQAITALLETYRLLGLYTEADGLTALLKADTQQGTSREAERRQMRDALFYSAQNYIDALRYPEAIQTLRQAIVLDTAFQEAYVALSYLYMGLGQLDSSLVTSRIAVGLDPRESIGQNNLGFNYYLLGEFRRALEHLEISYQLSPSLLTKVTRGLSYRWLGDLDRATQLHREAVEESRTRLGDNLYAGGAWRYNFTPRYAGDREFIKKSVLVRTDAHKQAMALFALSVDEALRRNLGDAQRLFDRAWSLPDARDFRCLVANDLASAQNYVRVAPETAAWIQERMRVLDPRSCL